MKKEKEEVEEPSAPFWMTTFSDMTTLLLVFFILILSYSTIELEKFKGAMSSMKGALGVLPEMGSAVPKNNRSLRDRLTNQEQGLSQQVKELQKSLENTDFEGMINVEITGEGVHFRLGDKLLFDLGQANIKPRALPILKKIAGIIKEGEYKEILVEGHTDNIPIHTKQFPSNWELSTARAMSVVRYLHFVEGIPGSK
ncbi:MAG TPA: hypothetical protein ENJ89_11160, partial [Caldithrix abyssi]|nr:hypothetical protein [Caldithrix abyssi]